jgi:hypothetical protein
MVRPDPVQVCMRNGKLTRTETNVQNDALTALLLDPFITYVEAVKQAQAMPAPPRGPVSTSTRPAAPNRPSGTDRRPARVGTPSVPVIHHPPATAG